MSPSPLAADSQAARFGWAALILFGFGLTEAVLGALVVHNPAVVADAGHNLADSLVLALVFLLVEAVARRFSSHFFSCTLRRVIGIGVLLLTVGLIAVFTFAEAGQNDAHLEPWLVVIIGLASFGLNFGLGRRMSGHHNASTDAMSNHLLYDALLSLAIVGGALAGFWLNRSWPNLVAAWIILALVTVHNGTEIWAAAQGIHRAENHQHAIEDEHHLGHAH